MYKRSLHMYAAGLLVALLAFFTIGTFSAHAATITDRDINEQKRVVMIELVSTLQEQVKLLQLIYIQRLQTEVTYLQGLVDEQS